MTIVHSDENIEEKLQEEAEERERQELARKEQEELNKFLASSMYQAIEKAVEEKRLPAHFLNVVKQTARSTISQQLQSGESINPLAGISVQSGEVAAVGIKPTEEQLAKLTSLELDSDGQPAKTTQTDEQVQMLVQLTQAERETLAGILKTDVPGDGSPLTLPNLKDQIPIIS